VKGIKTWEGGEGRRERERGREREREREREGERERGVHAGIKSVLYRAWSYGEK